MKFSDTISNQSTCGWCSSTWPKCCVRSPRPRPRSGRFQRFRLARMTEAAVAPSRGATASPRASILVLDRHGAAALAVARVLAGAAVVAALAAALTLAGVHALAAMLLGRGAAAIALARVLGGAAVVTGLAAAHALAGVQARAGVLRHAARLHLRAVALGLAAGARSEQEPADGQREDAGGQGSAFLGVLDVHVS